VTRRFVVRGRVQGVGYRWFVARTARGLGLTGHARNLADGSVEVVATGEGALLEHLAGALERGPPGAVVAGIDVENPGELPPSRSFDIL